MPRAFVSGGQTAETSNSADGIRTLIARGVDDFSWDRSRASIKTLCHPRGVKKLERTFAPVKSAVAWLHGARFSVEIDFRQRDAGQKVVENGGTARQTSPDVRRPEWCGASEGRTSYAARQYDRSKPPRRSVVLISALMLGGCSSGTISSLFKL